ncbi:MAG: ribonuclease [Pseudomonadota bacterium]|nr:ribonuclease [Pseudomonadota bacterium]
MKRMLFNATYQEELRVATVEGKKLINFDIETTSKTQRRGNIYKGIITRVEPSLEACFVDYGTDKQGFLPFKEIDSSYLPETSRERGFNRLSEGTELIIQVDKDERGNKGAALTTHISLPGRYLVLMPNSSRSGGISRRIDGEERDELKGVLSTLSIPQGMSIIARTAALGRFPEELQWDLNYLLKLWSAVKTASSNHVGSFLIYQESNLVVRSIRDHFAPDISEILIDMEDIYEQAKQFMSHVMPNFVDRVKFYNDDVPLFSRFQIEHQIETAYGRVVNLPSGGSVVIDHTEALTAIDVNSAKANKGSDIEATALATNMEAAEEVARQLRLRDLGGLVVVDFIDMESLRNQREVENYFKQQLGMDRARIQMSKLSKFGLLELSRQRLQASLGESTTISCPRCNGVGTIRGTESNAVHILRIIQEEAVKSGSYVSQLHIQLPVPVATYLLNEKREDIIKIETRMKIKIILIPNVHLDSPQYKIRKITSDSSEALASKASFNLVENFEENQTYQTNENKSDSSLQNNAVVKNITPSQPAPVMNGNLIKNSVGNTVNGLKCLVRGITGKVFNWFRGLGKSVDNSVVVAPVKDRQVRSGAAAAAPSQNKPSNTNSNSGRSNAKTRPVGINRSNNKIQTVRQNPTNNSNAGGGSNVNNGNGSNNNSINGAGSERRENTSAGRSPYKDVHKESSAKETAADNQRAKTNPARQQNVGSNVNATNMNAVNNKKVAINQAWQQPLAEQHLPAVTTSATQPIVQTAVKKQSQVAPIAATASVPSQQTIAAIAVARELPPPAGDRVVSGLSTTNNRDGVDTVVAVAKPSPQAVAPVKVVEYVNTIMQPVDLGAFELVDTDKTAAAVAAKHLETVLNTQTPVKRYNDIVVEDVVIAEPVNYELVETTPQPN